MNKEKVGIPKKLFHHDISNMENAWSEMRRLVNSLAEGFFPMGLKSYLETLETCGLNLEFAKKEYERLMKLNVRNKRNKLSNEFWEKFKLTTRDPREHGFNDYLSEYRIMIGEEKLSQLDKIEKETMEYLIHLNMKDG